MRQSEIDSIFTRQLTTLGSHHVSIGYSSEKLKAFTRYNSKLRHGGCVNTVKWFNDGEILASGSDDRTIKLWSASNSLERIKLIHTIETKHRGNIFCIESSPDNSNCVLSAAADGTLKSSYVDTKHAGTNIYTSDDIIHMFIFDCENPHLIYIAEECGTVSRIDLRTNAVDLVFLNTAAATGTSTGGMASYRRISSPGSVKVLAQCPYLGPSQLLVGGRGFEVGLLDLRLASSGRARSQSEMSVGSGEPATPQFQSGDFVKLWSPCYPAHLGDADSDSLKYSSPPAVHPSHAAGAMRSVSASGLQLSRDGRRMVVNYQGDQIYTYNIHGPSLSTVSGAEHSGATGVIGGHINYSTFLKGVSFFGPRDEYVLAGSDSGHVWMWESAPRLAPVQGAGDTDVLACEIVNVLQADGRTCNGVVPHPHAPVFASYGIDSDVKVWGHRTPTDADDDLSALRTGGGGGGNLTAGGIGSGGGGDLSSAHASMSSLQSSNNTSADDLSSAAASAGTKVRQNALPISGGADKYAQCSHGGERDRFRYERVSHSGGRFFHASMEHCELDVAASLLERNKKSAHSRLSDLLFRSGTSTFSSPRTVDPSQFNSSVYHARKRLFQDILPRNNSSKDGGGTSSAVTNEKSSTDIGPYMPSDLLHEVLELNELPSDVADFARTTLTEEPTLDLTAGQVESSVARSLLAYQQHTQAKCREGLGLAGYAREKSLPQDARRRSQYLGMAVYALLHVAHTSKQNGNAAFKAKDFATAHHFYCKAYRYCKYLLDIDISQSPRASGGRNLRGLRANGYSARRSLYFAGGGGGDSDSDDSDSFGPLIIEEDSEEEEEEEVEMSEEVEDEDEEDEDTMDDGSASFADTGTVSGGDVSVGGHRDKGSGEDGNDGDDEGGGDDDEDEDEDDVGSNDTVGPNSSHLLSSAASSMASSSATVADAVPAMFATPLTARKKPDAAPSMLTKPISSGSLCNLPGVNLFEQPQVATAGNGKLKCGGTAVSSTPAADAPADLAASLVQLETGGTASGDDGMQSQGVHQPAPPLSPQRVDARIRRHLYGSLAPDLAKTALNNLAACFIQMAKPADALNVCNEAMALVKHYNLEPDAKLYFRRGSVNLSLQNYEDAGTDLAEAARISPGDASIAVKMREVKRLQDAKRKREFKIYNKMFE